MKEEISRISQGVERGDEEARKEFWRIVGRVKRGEITVTEEDIEELRKIRDKLFRKRIILSAKKGSVLFPLGFLTSTAIFLWANFLNLPSTYLYLSIFLLEVPVIYFGFLTGRLLASFVSGIGFEGFYQYSPLEFGVKLNYRDYLAASQSKRVTLYATTLCFQGVVLVALSAVVFLFNPDAVLIPVGFLVLWLIGSLIIHYTAKTGELHRFLRELKIASRKR